MGYKTVRSRFASQYSYTLRNDFLMTNLQHKMISLITTALLCHGLLVRAEPPVTAYAVTGDNRYDYSNSVTNTGYLGKEGHAGSRDFYGTETNGHNVNQDNAGDSFRSTSYGGFSPSSHNNGYGSYSNEDFANQYPPSTHTSATFRGYSNTPSTADTSFEGFTGQAASNINHFSSSGYKAPSYIPFTDNISGSSSASYSASIPEASSFGGYSTVGGSDYSQGDHGIAQSNEPSYSFGGNSDFGKHKEGFLVSGKYMSDLYPSDTRYVRGNQGSTYHGPTTMYLMSSPSSGPLSGLRGSTPHVYGKFNKYGNKYSSDFGIHSGPRDQEPEYLASGKGKVILVKDNKPSTYQSYPSSYLSKLMASGSYKSKLSSLMNYPGPSVGHPTSLHSSFGNSLYSEGHIPRGYRSSGSYITPHSSVYPAYH